MTKIRVELEVPENCKDCSSFDDDHGYCNLFGYYVYKNNFERCDECKQAEVEND